MAKRLVKYSVLIFAFIGNFMFAQAPKGAYKMLNVLDNLDSVIVSRQLSPWWFGVTGGITLSTNLGNLQLPDIVPNNGDVIPTNLVKYNTGYGSGMFIGLYGEWLPIEEMWGVTLRINLLERREATSESDILPDTFQTKYVNTYTLNYLTISPSARYNLPLENLFVFGGADLEFNIAKEVLTHKEFNNSAEISHDRVLPIKPNSFRAAFHLGVGYDIFAGDLYNSVRAYIAPFASIHIGSKEISAYNSSRIPFMLKLGANIKFNLDEKQFDTIPVDKDYVEPPNYVASLKKEKGVEFDGFNKISIISASLKQIPESEKIDVVVKEETKVSATEKVKVDPKEEPQKKNIIINPNSSKIFYFSSSESSILTKVQKEYLDALAEYMKKNLSVRIRITGHSDNAGTTEQNQKRSENRALVVVQYLLKKDITRQRMLDRGRGALEPVADNTTEAGRSKNRRVEIQIAR